MVKRRRGRVRTCGVTRLLQGCRVDRRAFIKQSSALAVAAAFPLPAPAAPAFGKNAMLFIQRGDVYVAEHDFPGDIWICTRCNQTAERIVETGVACKAKNNR